MTQVEIILRLITTLVLVLAPALWIIRRYFPQVIALFQSLLAKYSQWKAHRDDEVSVQQPLLWEPGEFVSPDSSQDISTEKIHIEDMSPLEAQEVITKKLSERDAQLLEALKFEALSHKERGKLDLYEKKLIEWLALDSENYELMQLLGEHYFTTGNLIKALSLLKKVINNEPDNHKVIRQIGQIYLSQGEQSTAKLLIEKAITLKDDNPKYHISMVEIHYENQDIKQAIRSMEKILKLRPTNIDYLLTIATLHEENAEPSKAMSYYSKIIELDPMHEIAKKAIRRLSS